MDAEDDAISRAYADMHGDEDPDAIEAAPECSCGRVLGVGAMDGVCRECWDLIERPLPEAAE